MLVTPFPFSFVLIPTFNYCDAILNSTSSTPPYLVPNQLSSHAWNRSLPKSLYPDPLLSINRISNHVCSFLWSLFFVGHSPCLEGCCFSVSTYWAVIQGPAKIGLLQPIQDNPSLEITSFLHSYKLSLSSLQLLLLANIHWLWMYTRYNTRQRRDK